MNLTFHHASVAQLVEHRAAMGGGVVSSTSVGPTHTEEKVLPL